MSQNWNRHVGLRGQDVSDGRNSQGRLPGGGDLAGCINPKAPRGQMPPSTAQEASMWLISAWGAMLFGRVRQDRRVSIRSRLCSFQQYPC